MATPSFLTLPDRQSAPRAAGLTHVLDPGVSPAAANDLLAGAGAFVDIWKTGWGTAYVDPRLPEKIAVLEQHGVASCLGGTMLEIAWAQGVADACLVWAHAVGFRHVEVSRGTVPMTVDDKRALVRRAADRFAVITEVGAKDPDQQHTLDQWRDEAAADREAGAHLVVAEGRQSGTVGIFDAGGQVREDVVDALVDAVGPAHLVFEAPRTHQQAWFVRRLGPDVNIGNVALDDVLGLEALRLGLRSDTASSTVGAAISAELAR
jgi:phosphosulfolactate synthase